MASLDIGGLSPSRISDIFTELGVDRFGQTAGTNIGRVCSISESEVVIPSRSDEVVSSVTSSLFVR